MMVRSSDSVHVAIACGGTGGHLFPGMAVAERLLGHNVDVTLMVSPKEVDQLALRTAAQMKFVTLPAVGLTGLRVIPFLQGFLKSYRAACRVFRLNPPRAALAMGGFTSAPPILAAKRRGAATFLHESNSVPGRANRWLSRAVDQAFIGFSSAAARLRCRRVSLTGTPVRPKFQALDPARCRHSLGLDPQRPVVLVMGGSQGAHAINQLVMTALPLLAKAAPEWQWIHLSGPADAAQLEAAYQAVGLKALVYPFCAEVEMAMGAATACLSRAGASSLAELAALGLPAILVPFPAATDNHQFHNAQAFEQSGAARLLEQRAATPEALASMLNELVGQQPARDQIKSALARWHFPQAADQIAQAILDAIGVHAEAVSPTSYAAPGDSSPLNRCVFLSPSEPCAGLPRGGA